ncbi:hypothetical protein AO385_1966 [Moraxella catarrhalis]|uniref:Uncharacterized protein n=1 Tax=Moraxella catarrhalis TaxID=480 RepID=A0A198UDN7_MORCA|nr:hypothetical protein AO384_1905 [Moraxella catarrhalis]OAU95542.1 hypothetical protein AO385_1966 [Moraxella catarrhalis]OAU96848.1 hypothetical protein AO383_1365 [Moraxella catarrhalis]OAV02133.1 hypothetical protein AO382_0499 [Moraxella catarrhalis]
MERVEFGIENLTLIGQSKYRYYNKHCTNKNNYFLSAKDTQTYYQEDT